MHAPALVRLRVQYPNRRVLLASARAGGDQLSLFVVTTNTIAVGTPVKVEVVLDEGAQRFEIEGRARAMISAPSGKGVDIVFEGAHKRAVAQMLALCAGRSLDDGTALDSRHAVNVSCVVSVRGAHIKAALRDVSKTGAFIKAPVLTGLRRDAELVIQVEPLLGRWGGTALKAKVIWVGEKQGIRGFGVRFVDATTHVRESLKKHFPTLAK